MATTRKRPDVIPEPPILYVGATTCDFVPDWAFTEGDPDALALCRACHAAPFGELTPMLALADLFAERGDSRETWIRIGCDLWTVAETLDPGQKSWDYERVKAVLEPVCQTVAGWRLSCLWGHLVAYHSPSPWDGKKMGGTWRDANVGIISRSVWWWCLGLLKTRSQAYAAGMQASAAWRQSSAAGRQADAAGRQASAAGSQASAAWMQASAAGSQADAAVMQADAAWMQADAARSQAYAVWMQASAAGMQADVWRFARTLWDKCIKRLPELEQSLHGG